MGAQRRRVGGRGRVVRAQQLRQYRRLRHAGRRRARARRDAARARRAWTIARADAARCPQLPADGWKATASHNPDDAVGAPSPDDVEHRRSRRQAGMWFQVELPKSETITELQFQSPPAGERGAAVAAGGAPINTPTGPGFPRGFRVEISQDGTSWQPVAEVRAPARRRP